MDRGGTVRAEITVVTGPQKKRVSVFCPTCKKQIEVDNLMVEDEVGFDCPGCGRPYRIVPAAKAEASPQEAAPEKRTMGLPNMVVGAGLAFLAAILYLMLEDMPCLMALALLAVAGAMVAWLVTGRRRRRREPARPRSRLGAVAHTLLLSPVLLLLWHFTVARIDPEEAFAALAPILGALILAYAAVHAYRPDFRGDYLLAAGLLLILIAAATMVLVSFGEVRVSMALVLAMGGAVMLVLSTYHRLDRDAAILDGAVAAGMFLLLLTVTELVWECSETIDYIATGSVAMLGATLVGFRAARERTGRKDYSSHLAAAVPVALAFALAVYGVFLLYGGAIMTGAVELAAAVPFAYFGGRQVFDENWPYRVPIVVFMVAVLILAFTATLVT
jgi:hypothetical protein